MFSPRIKTRSLALVSRALGTMLNSGIAIQRAFQLASRKTGDARCRKAMAEIAELLGRGEDVSSAFKAQGDRFPPLMVDMVGVAEQTGQLPEVLTSLADHFDNNLRLRRDFLSAIAWPVFQLFAAIFVIAGLLLILGWIATSQGGKPYDPLGWGLTGASGALIWLSWNFGTMLALFVAYKLIASSLGGKKFLHGLLLGVPVLGTCMRSFALARFSWAFALTQQAGMPIDRSLEASLRATSNGAFQAATGRIWSLVQSGEPLHEALAATRLFPEEFVEMVHVAETSGTVPETLDHLSPQLEEQARRSLAALTAALGWLIWMIVAVFIVFLVFSIFLSYLNVLQGALKGV